MPISDIFHTVTSIVERATKRIQRPHANLNQLVIRSRPHLAGGFSFIRFLNSKRKSKSKGGTKKKLEDGVLWRRTILMGEKCDPLAFSGVIHYDGDGNQVMSPPCKSPLRSPLPTYLLNLENVK